MPKKDIAISIIIGFFTGLIWTGVFIRLGVLDKLELGNAIWGLAVIVPIIFVFGLYLGEWLSGRWRFLKSFARFVMVGFFNAGIDLGIFNLLMFLTGIEKGLPVSLFKSVAFITALVNSYFWNKHWAFKAGESRGGSVEFSKFIVVSIGGLLVNVSTTSLIIFAIQPMFGFAQLGWNNIAAVAGNAVGLIWNFIGYRFIVFKATKYESARTYETPTDL